MSRPLPQVPVERLGRPSAERHHPRSATFAQLDEDDLRVEVDVLHREIREFLPPDSGLHQQRDDGGVSDSLVAPALADFQKTEQLVVGQNFGRRLRNLRRAHAVQWAYWN